MCTRLIACLVMLGLITSAQAFEPGIERVCTPSADGQSFECHDKSGAPVTPAKTTPVDRSVARPVAVAAPERAHAAEVSDVPSYLLQSPRASQPVRRAQPVATTPATSKPANVDRTSTRVTSTTAETESTAATSPAAPAAKPGRTESSANAMKAEPRHEPAAAAAPASAAQAAQPTMSQAPARPAVTSSHAMNIGDADAFLGLPASHFTLVLASVRNARALDGLIGALDNLPGQLYLLKLDMPDGDWYSLCWSQFVDLDSARSARTSLPPDAAISSGWPRKIGLLQKEISR